MFTWLVELLRKVAPITWHAMLENVASMSVVDRSIITNTVEETYETTAYEFDAAAIGQVRRPRLYRPNWTLAPDG
eukprot:11867422-Karenia_brevis.AAC.1